MSLSPFRFLPWQPAQMQQPDVFYRRPKPTLWSSPTVVIAGAAVVLLVVFVTLGPQLWRQDPAQQWLSLTSQGPLPSQWAVVVDDHGQWQPRRKVRRLTVRAANTEYVRLQWPVLPDVERYQIYRGPADEPGIGLPLGTTANGHYEDVLQLRRQIYRYTVVDADRGLQLFALDVRPKVAISLFEAQLQGLVPVSVGDIYPEYVELPGHPLGTDALGRDILARLMAGGQTSLFVGVVAPLLYISFGCLLGAVAGFAGGWVDQATMRLVDFVIALPFLLFMILLRVAFGIGPGENGIFPLIIAMLILSWPGTARLIRGQVLSLRQQPFVEAARLAGLSNLHIIFRHVFPNVLPLILVAFSFAIPQAIFTEAFLSFIGMGVAPPTTSWGALCNDGIKTLLSHPRQLLLPALMISISVLAFNILGDALRDLTDKRSGGVPQ